MAAMPDFGLLILFAALDSGAWWNFFWIPGRGLLDVAAFVFRNLG